MKPLLLKDLIYNIYLRFVVFLYALPTPHATLAVGSTRELSRFSLYLQITTTDYQFKFQNRNGSIKLTKVESEDSPFLLKIITQAPPTNPKSNHSQTQIRGYTLRL